MLGQNIKICDMKALFFYGTCDLCYQILPRLATNTQVIHCNSHLIFYCSVILQYLRAYDLLAKTCLIGYLTGVECCPQHISISEHCHNQALFSVY